MTIRSRDDFLHCVQKISAGFSRVVSQLELPDAPVRPDLSSAAKDFVCDMLNQIYGWVPAEELPDIPPIDLTDAEGTTAVYVTMDNSIQGLRSLLAEFKSHPGKSRFSKLIVVVVTYQKIPDLAKRINQYPHFIGESDIWNIRSLVQNLENLKLDQLEPVVEYLNRGPGCSWIPRDAPLYCLPRIPECGSYFAGSRTRELEQLCRALWNNEPVFLWGEAGMGKTMLASYAAGLYTPPRGAYYLRCQVPLEEGAEAMRETILYADLAGYRFRGTDNEGHDLEYQERLEILRRDYRDALLIVDEFERPGRTLEELRSESSFRDLIDTGVRLIFTTRTPAGEGGIEVGPLSLTSFRDLTYRSLHYYSWDEKEELERLQKIYDNTLVAAMTAQACDVLPNHYRSLRGAMRTCAEQTHQTMPRDLALLKTLLEKSFAHLKSPEKETEKVVAIATAILQCACILAEAGLGDSFLTDHIPEEWQDLLTALRRLGWIRSQDGALVIPKRIREFSLRQSVIYPTFFDELWNAFALHPYDPVHLWRIARCLCRAADALPDREGVNALRAARLLELIGQYPAALRYAMRVVELREQELSGDHPDLAAAYSDAGQLYGKLKRYDKALEYHEGALEVLKESLAPDHPDLAVAHDRAVEARRALRQHKDKKRIII